MKHDPLRRFGAFAAIAMLGLAGCSKEPDMSASGSSGSSVSATASSSASAVTVEVQDIDVTEHVKTALLGEASLKGTDIAVVTLKGDVRLTGIVDTQAQIDDALRIARAAEGAHTIHDELTLKK